MDDLKTIETAALETVAGGSTVGGKADRESAGEKAGDSGRDASGPIGGPAREH